MSWAVRVEGATAVEGLSLEQVAEGLDEGRWGPTDEVRGPDERDFVPLETHPQLEEAAALEPLPAPHDEETSIDMTPLIDVCLVLLFIFILILVVAKLVKQLDAPDAPRNEAGRLVITPDQAKKQSIHVVVAREDGRTVYRIEDKAVAPDQLESMLTQFVRTTNHTRLLLEAGDDVPHGDVIAVEDAAKGAHMEKVWLVKPGGTPKP
jgi:biopolymer transport protein ExbD